jgi:putative nucleotidyltransferase with HDIG domain
VLVTMATPGASRGEIVAGIESDTGLTIAMLRRAQTVRSRRRAANVSDAVVALTPPEIEETIAALPRADFPWRTTPLDLLRHRCRVHAQAVARAADRIARELHLAERDDVIVAALLHDIGKLVMDRALAEHAVASERASTPEERIREEQRALAMDHAGLGAHVLRAWGLPDSLVRAVAAHHSSDTAGDVATYVRLADMVAHHAQGDAVDRHAMLRLAGVCGLSATKLRDILFDLPHAGGSRRRRADPSPLTKRETAVLRVLAQGKVYKEIGIELGVAASTVRTHLHHVYEKLAVDNRAQAVLRATEMGWI